MPLNVQDFMCVACSSGSSSMRAPSSTSRIPSSMSSIIGVRYSVASNPPLAWKASRLMAPSPAQNEYAGPAAPWCT